MTPRQLGKVPFTVDTDAGTFSLFFCEHGLRALALVVWLEAVYCDRFARHGYTRQWFSEGLVIEAMFAEPERTQAVEM